MSKLLPTGIGDEFAVAIPVVTACVASLVLWWACKRRENRHVHPDQVKCSSKT